MKRILYTLSVGLLLIQCDLSHDKFDKLDDDNESVLYALIEADTLIEKDYAIIKQPSYDFFYRETDDKIRLGFNGRLLKIDFTDYFELSDTVFINRQLNNKQNDIWDKYLIDDFNIVETDWKNRLN